MNFNNFTIKSQEAISILSKLPAERVTSGHRARVHLLRESHDRRGITHHLYLFPKSERTLPLSCASIDCQNCSRTKVSGGEPYLSHPVQMTSCRKRGFDLKKQGDEYVTPKLLAIFSGQLSGIDHSQGRRIEPTGTRPAIAELRKGKKLLTKVPKISPIRPLSKYAINLNDAPVKATRPRDRPPYRNPAVYFRRSSRDAPKQP